MSFTCWVIETNISKNRWITHNLCYVPLKAKKTSFTQSENFYLVSLGVVDKRVLNSSSWQRFKWSEKRKTLSSFNIEIMQKRLSWSYPGPIVCEWPLYNPKKATTCLILSDHFLILFTGRKRVTRETLIFHYLAAASLSFLPDRWGKRKKKNSIKQCFFLYCVNPPRDYSIVSDGRVKRVFTITLVELAERKERAATVLEGSLSKWTV